MKASEAPAFLIEKRPLPPGKTQIGSEAALWI